MVHAPTIDTMPLVKVPVRLSPYIRSQSSDRARVTFPRMCDARVRNANSGQDQKTRVTGDETDVPPSRSRAPADVAVAAAQGSIPGLPVSDVLALFSVPPAAPAVRMSANERDSARAETGIRAGD